MMGFVDWTQARLGHYKDPIMTRWNLAVMLDEWRKVPKHKRPWLCDAWQDWLNYNFNLFIYLAGVNYLLSRPRLRKWFDEPYAKEGDQGGEDQRE